MSNLLTKLLLVSFFLTAFLGVSVNVALGACNVYISPRYEAIHTGETLQFSAVVSNPLLPRCNTPCYSWEVTEVGSNGSTIDANGLYTAGSTAGADVITVTDACNGNISDSTTVSIGPIPTSTYEFERMWPPLKPSYFHEVWTIAVDSNGFVYVPDKINSCIQKFTSDGQFVTKWGSNGSGDGEFDNPGSIAVDNNGFVYVVDYVIFNGGFIHPRIQKFTSDGQFVTEWGGPGSGDGNLYGLPTSIALDGNGFVYVVDSYHILKFTSDGQFVTQWGSGCRLHDGSGCEDPDGDGPLELGDGQFHSSYSSIEIAVDINGFVYVSDDNNRIQKFTSDGQFVTKWGSYASGDGEFEEISDVAVDNNGFIYAADYLNDRIKKFTSDGQFVDKWQSYGDGDGEFHYPTDIIIDLNGFVYVYDGRIQMFSSDGQFLEELESHGQLKAIDGNNFFYYVDNTAEDGLIKKVASDGEIVALWGSLGTGDGEFEEISDIAVDNSGYVYVADSDSKSYPSYDPFQHQRIQKFTSDGQFVTKWGSHCSVFSGVGCEDPDGDGPLELGDGQFFFPHSIAVDMNGFVYVPSNGHIQKFTSDGQFVDKWNAYCSDLAIDSNGFLYCTYTDQYPMIPSEYTPQSVLKFTLDGQFVDKWGSFGSDPGEMAGIGGIAVGPNEKIYITDIMNHRVQVFEETPSITRPPGCERDVDCDDGEFCNGTEICIEGTCQPGTEPCADPTSACDEESDLCVEGGPSIQLLPNPYTQSRWMPMVLLLRIVGTETHFDGSSRVTFDPPGAVMALPIPGDDEHILMIGMLMPAWLMSIQSIGVTVTTGAEVVSEELNLEFPFMMNKQIEKLVDVPH